MFPAGCQQQQHEGGWGSGRAMASPCPALHQCPQVTRTKGALPGACSPTPVFSTWTVGNSGLGSPLARCSWMVVTRRDSRDKAPTPCPGPPPHLTLIDAQVLRARRPDLQHQQAAAGLTQGLVFAPRGQQGAILVPPAASPKCSQVGLPPMLKTLSSPIPQFQVSSWSPPSWTPPTQRTGGPVSSSRQLEPCSELQPSHAHSSADRRRSCE